MLRRADVTSLIEVSNDFINITGIQHADDLELFGTAFSWGLDQK